MTPHKAAWIEYMMNVMKPFKGLDGSCRTMLAERYDAAFNEGRRAVEDEDYESIKSALIRYSRY